MYQPQRYPLLALAALSLVGCGKTPDAQATTDAPADTNGTSTLAGSIEAGLKRSREHRAERVAHGDTLVLPYQELAGYLPASIPSYATGETTQGYLATSSAKRKYTQGEGEIVVSLLDLNGAYAMMENKAAVFGTIPAGDTAERTDRPFAPPG